MLNFKCFELSNRHITGVVRIFVYSLILASSNLYPVFYHRHLLSSFTSFKGYFYKTFSLNSANYSLPANTLKRQFCHSKSFAKMRPVGIVDDWSLTLSPQDFICKTTDLINRCRKLYDSVGNIPDSDVNCESVLKVLNDADCEMSTERYFLDSSQNVSTDEDIRNASTEADRMLREFDVETRMRKDIFQKLLILQEKNEALKPDYQRYLIKLIRMGKRNGLHLDEATQKNVKELNTKINTLTVDFVKNLNDVNTTVQFTDQELDGLPADFLQNLERIPDTGKAEVTLKYPHYFPIMEKCKVPETRRKLAFAFNTQCIDENGPIITEIRKLRHQLALLLGYPSHAAYVTEKLMSKSAETVQNFLHKLAAKMTPLWEKEKKYLLELKEKECAELGLPFDGKLNSWDGIYYTTRAKEMKYAIDLTKLKEYFPLPVVKQGLLNIYQDLLGLKFEQVEGEVWHEDVELMSVKDANSGTLLGYFFLDLFPRPFKYGHACFSELQHSFTKRDGSRQVAVGAMVANFSKPTKDKPALLDHDEVVTFFHEFGHAMHYLCIETELPFFHIMCTERDFIEAPSQMLENWCWEKEPLKKMSAHYLDNCQIPEDILDALIQSRLANVGYRNLNQIILALFDQRIHTNAEGNSQDLFYELTREITGIEPQAGTHFACHFMHVINEYDAQYYGYSWSEVFSMDMFETRFKGENTLNPDIGRDYRNKILRPGATKDGKDLISSFLGREPTQDAFLRSKGLDV